jgi:hypothetical protein
MTPGELRMRVVRETGAAVLLLALAAAWLAGASGFVGVAGAGAITVANFWWLARGVSATITTPPLTPPPLESGSGSVSARSTAPATAPAVAGRARAVWILAAGGRFLALVAAFAVLCAMGWAHPVAIVVGLSVLPCDLIAVGLRAART